MKTRRLLVTLLGFAAPFASAGTAAAQCEPELARLAPAQASPGASVGYRVHVEEDLAILLANYDDTSTPHAGSAYVYERDSAGSWSLAQRLTASDGAYADYLGWSVDVSGSRLALGAPGVDGPGAVDQGAVYVFERDASGTWVESAKIEPRRAPDADFGYALALDGDELLVGAPAYRLDEPSSAYLYRRNPRTGHWKLAQRIQASDPAFELLFGYEVHLADGMALITGSATSFTPASNAIYVYERSGQDGPYVEAERLHSPTGSPTDFFGADLSFDGRTLAVAATGEFDFELGTIGAIYLYERDPAGGSFQSRRRVVSHRSEGGFLPESVAVDGDWLVSGASVQAAGGLEGAGAVHVFHRESGGPGAFGEVARLVASDAHADARFGLEVALRGTTLVVGSPEEIIQGPSAGLGYVFDLEHLGRSGWRNDTAGANPDVLDASGPALGGIFVATADLAPSGHARALLLGFASPAETALPGGAVLLGAGRVFRAPAAAGPLARFELAVPNDPSLCGRELVTQAVLFGGGPPFALSNAQDVVVGR